MGSSRREGENHYLQNPLPRVRAGRITIYIRYICVFAEEFGKYRSTFYAQINYHLYGYVIVTTWNNSRSRCAVLADRKNEGEWPWFSCFRKKKKWKTDLRRLRWHTKITVEVCKNAVPLLGNSNKTCGTRPYMCVCEFSSRRCLRDAPDNEKSVRNKKAVRSNRDDNCWKTDYRTFVSNSFGLLFHWAIRRVTD